MPPQELQVTCVACGGLLGERRTNVEVVLDPEVRYVYTHWGCSSFTHRGSPILARPFPA
jgi:hypothetical protein